MDPAATSAIVGTHPATITFTDRTNGTTQTRAANLIVTDPPALQVTPDTLLKWSGNQGGPFLPDKFDYQLATTKGSVDFSIEQVLAG